MAHSPKKKAAVVADLVLGMTQRDAAAKHGVSAGTVATWAIELETEQNQANTTAMPVRQQAFEAAFYECLEAITKAMTTFARVCQDEQWVKDKPGGASELAVRTTEFADRIMARARSQSDSPASPAN